MNRALQNTFQKAISRDDPRLIIPHIAVFVLATEFGPVVPLIKRRKYKSMDGKPELDSQGKRIFEEWFDLPGGKSDPIYDPQSSKAEEKIIEKLKKKNSKLKIHAEDLAKIIDIEHPHVTAARETREETGLFVTVTKELANAPHPAKKGIIRVFHEAALLGGTFKNLVPNEHDYVLPTTPENAISLLGDRVPPEVKTFFRNEARRIDYKIDRINRQIRNNVLTDMDLYREPKFRETMIGYGYTPIIAFAA